jgi:hypothetical protein
MSDKKEKVLSEQQQKFIEALLSDAKGDYKKALQIAGYSENTRASDIIKALRSEIIEASLNHLALNAPRAAHEMTDTLNNPMKPGATTVIKIASDILNRVGATPGNEQSVRVPSGGLFIMPAKETPPWMKTQAEDKEEDTEDEHEGTE